jgi:hypothetical protein
MTEKTYNTYRATFRTPTHWTDHNVYAATLQEALLLARDFHKTGAPGYDWQPYKLDFYSLKEIILRDSKEGNFLLWQSDDLALCRAASDLRDALAVAIERLKIYNRQGKEDEYIEHGKMVLKQVSRPFKITDAHGEAALELLLRPSMLTKAP